MLYGDDNEYLLISSPLFPPTYKKFPSELSCIFLNELSSDWILPEHCWLVMLVISQGVVKSYWAIILLPSFPINTRVPSGLKLMPLDCILVVHPARSSVLAVQDRVEVLQGVDKENCSIETLLPDVPSLRITYISVPSVLKTKACGLSITSVPPPSAIVRGVSETLAAVLISNGVVKEYSITDWSSSSLSLVTYTLVPSGFMNIPLKSSASEEISFDCLNSKKAKALE